MATVHIEDKWFCDPRRLYLRDKIGDPIVDGVMSMAWLMAAWNSKHRKSLVIPLIEFQMLDHWELVLKCNLAERVDGGIYIKGSRDFYPVKKSTAKGRRDAGKEPADCHQTATIRNHPQPGVE